MMDTKTTVTSFSIGTLVSVITLGYVSQAWSRKGKDSSVPIENIVIGIPLFYGITNVVAVYYVKSNNIEGTRANVTIGIFGAIMGLIFSLYGRNVLNLPQKIFGFTEENDWQVHIYAAILYFFIFSLVIANIDKVALDIK